MPTYYPNTTRDRERGSSPPKSGKVGGPLGGIIGQVAGAGQRAQQNLGNSLFSAQWVPGGSGNSQRLGDIFGGKSGGRGGGGGFNAYAAQQAEEERRRAAMREAIMARYGGAIGRLGEHNTQAQAALGNYYGEAQGRMSPIFANNRALQGQYSQQLADVARYSTRGVIDEGDMLARDLQGQGVQGQGLGDLRGVVGSNVTDMLAARGAGDQYNTRLGQVMATSETDNAALLSAILQGGQSQRENSYAQALAQLEAEQAMKLAELA